jgi:putative addiction module component (TIGR02574 family)
MPDRVEEIAAQGRALVPEDRVRLVDLLLESLQQAADSNIDSAWAAEIARRVQAHERGEGELFDVDVVMAEAEKLAP